MTTDILLVSRILLLFHSSKGSRNKWQNMEIFQNICYFALGTAR